MTHAVQQARQPIAHITPLPYVVIENIISLTPLGKVGDIHVGLTSIQNPNGDQIEACNFAKRCMDLRNHPEVSLEIRRALKPAGCPAAQEKLWTSPTDDLTYDELYFVHKNIREELAESLKSLPVYQLPDLLKAVTLKGCKELAQTITQSDLFNNLSDQAIQDLLCDHDTQWNLFGVSYVLNPTPNLTIFPPNAHQIETLAIIANTPRFNGVSLSSLDTWWVVDHLITCSNNGNFELLKAILTIPHFKTALFTHHSQHLELIISNALGNDFIDILEHMLTLKNYPQPQNDALSALQRLQHPFQGNRIRSILQKAWFSALLSTKNFHDLLEESMFQNDAQTVDFLLTYHLDRFDPPRLKESPVYSLLKNLFHPAHLYSSDDDKMREVLSRHRPLLVSWLYQGALIGGLTSAVVCLGINPLAGLAGFAFPQTALSTVVQTITLAGATLYSTEHLHHYHHPDVLTYREKRANDGLSIHRQISPIVMDYAIGSSVAIASRVFSFFRGR